MCCDFPSQDLNHLFWACPILDNQKQRLLNFLIACKLQSPFSVEYLLGNMNKRIASIICSFVSVIENVFNIIICNISAFARIKIFRFQ